MESFGEEGRLCERDEAAHGICGVLDGGLKIERRRLNEDGARAEDGKTEREQEREISHRQARDSPVVQMLKSSKRCAQRRRKTPK